MMTELDFKNYVRTPFQVTAIQITEENIHEVAKLIGTVQTRKDKKYIRLNRDIVPNMDRAQLGWYVTKFGDRYRCYNDIVFEDQFMSMEGMKVIAWDFPEDPEDPPVIISPVGDRAELPEPTEGGLTPTGEDGSGNDHPNPIVDGVVSSGADTAGEVRPDIQSSVGSVNVVSPNQVRTDADIAMDAITVDDRPYGTHSF